MSSWRSACRHQQIASIFFPRVAEEGDEPRIPGHHDAGHSGLLLQTQHGGPRCTVRRDVHIDPCFTRRPVEQHAAAAHLLESLNGGWGAASFDQTNDYPLGQASDGSQQDPQLDSARLDPDRIRSGRLEGAHIGDELTTVANLGRHAHGNFDHLEESSRLYGRPVCPKLKRRLVADLLRL